MTVGRLNVRKVISAQVSGTHFAAKGVKSSCVTFEGVSFDWMSFSASSVISFIPSFGIVRIGDTLVRSTHSCCQGIH